LNRAIQGQGTEADVLAKYSTAGLLALHDLGAEDWKERTAAVMYELIDTRVEHCRQTIITTNLTMARLSERDDRIASRLSSFVKIKLDGSDRRIRAGGRK
jgi:DNA replication protein DnaC